jgi:hypothetical protein
LPPAPPTPLLDTVTSSYLAFSTRKLRSAYSGPALTLRRDSDNGTLNIGFDASGNLDTAAVTAHLGAANGFVSRWYDQSGNAYNFGNSTAATQPRLLLNALNGKACLSFDGISQFLDDLANNTAADSDWSFLAAIDLPTVTGGYRTIFGTRRYTPTAGSLTFVSLTSQNRPGYAVDATMYHGPNTAVTGRHVQAAILKSPNLAEIRVDKATLASGLTYAQRGMYNQSRIGREVGSTYHFEGKLGELLVFPRALSAADLTAAEDSLAAYFVG